MRQDAREPVEPAEHLVRQRQASPGLAAEFEIRHRR